MAFPEGHSVFSELFERPTSVYLGGTNRALLNWVAFAAAQESPRGYVWTDVRLRDQLLDEESPIGRRVIPPERLRVVSPAELAPLESPKSRQTSRLQHADESPETIARLVQFLGLAPRPSEGHAHPSANDGPPMLLILSNAHRIAALYPTAKVGAVLQAIVASGGTLLLTFADAPPAGRMSFQYALQLEGGDLRDWRRAVLHVEKGSPSGPLRSGSRFPLFDLPPVLRTLSQHLGSTTVR
jgi:hypothetical protein